MQQKVRAICKNKSYVEQEYVSDSKFKTTFAAFKKFSKPSSMLWQPSIATILGNTFTPSVAYAMWHAVHQGDGLATAAFSAASRQPARHL